MTDSWMSSAACAGLHGLMHDEARVVDALAVCRSCPVVAECRAEFRSLPLAQRDAADGVWFGTTAGMRNPKKRRVVDRAQAPVVGSPVVGPRRRLFDGPRCPGCARVVSRAGVRCMECRVAARCAADRAGRVPVVTVFDEDRRRVAGLLACADGRL